MTPTVAIIAPGNMGAGVGQRLTENGVSVLTSLAGRSAASEKRAREAGMRAVADAQLMEADFLLSIVPPGEALALAHRLAPLLTAANKKPVYADCNAVSPATQTEIAAAIAATGTPFVGAGIIGPPPKPGSTNTKIYASGPAAGGFAKLNDYGLIVRVLEGPLTAAAALKMSYAGITKGFTALGAAMMLAATRAGAAEALQGRARRKPAGAARLARAPDAAHVRKSLSLGGRARRDRQLRRRGSSRARHARRRRAALRAHRGGFRGRAKGDRRARCVRGEVTASLPAGMSGTPRRHQKFGQKTGQKIGKMPYDSIIPIS